MKLYHGGLDIIMNPRILRPTRTLDYGVGFYTTTSLSQAQQWVARKKSDVILAGVVNIYEFDESLLYKSGLEVLMFKEPSEEWVDFVMDNRLDKDFIHNYDIVYGPVADDRVYAAFALFEGGLLDKDGLIRELKAYKLVDQILFHTERALGELVFVKAKELKL